MAPPTGVNPTTSPREPIILRRFDDDCDCERLAAERDNLFPLIPEVDWYQLRQPIWRTQPSDYEFGAISRTVGKYVR